MCELRPCKHLLTLFFILLLPTCTRTQNAVETARPARTVIRAARMLDVAAGRVVSGAVIIVKGDRIEAAGAGLPVPEGAQVLDLGDVTLLPGLVDAHTHVTYHFDEAGRFGVTNDPTPEAALRYAAENARRTVEAGITTIRNLGAGQLVDIRLRDEINRGERVGPRMLVSGQPLTPREVFGVADPGERRARVREFVRARVAEGADVIKIFEAVDERGEPYFGEGDIRAAVEEAARAGRRVAVHAHEAASVRAAVRGGCASVEHGTFLDEAAIKLLAARGTALVPTLYLPTHYIEHKAQFPTFDAGTWAFFERLRGGNLANAQRAKKAGVWIVAGSDAVAGLHGTNAREIEWLVKAGLKPAEALRAATSDAARLLGLEGKVGELKAGAFADVIAVAGDPLADITSVERVAFVMKGGKVLRRN